MQCHGLQAIMQKLDAIPNLLQDPFIVIQVAKMPQYRVKQARIDDMRARFRKTVISEQESYRMKPRVDPKRPQAFRFEMGTFLQKLPLFKGIQQFYLHDIAKEKRREARRQRKSKQIKELTLNSQSL